MNHTVGIDLDLAGFPDEKYLPKNYQEYDPLRMFPSDFRLWDPHPPKKEDPKIYSYQNQTYYLPFEMTICSREGFSWFYSNIYEDKPLLNIDKTVQEIQKAFLGDNLAVINMPPNTNGQLVHEDIKQVLRISEQLGRRRNIQK